MRYLKFWNVAMVALCLYATVALWADSTLIQPITYGQTVSITVNLTPNEPVSLPLLRDTKDLTIIIPEGQRISIDGAETTGTIKYPSITQNLSVTVFGSDRVTIAVEESK